MTTSNVSSRTSTDFLQSTVQWREGGVGMKTLLSTGSSRFQWEPIGGFLHRIALDFRGGWVPMKELIFRDFRDFCLPALPLLLCPETVPKLPT